MYNTDSLQLVPPLMPSATEQSLRRSRAEINNQTNL
jgi:hypothetical protein